MEAAQIFIQTYSCIQPLERHGFYNGFLVDIPNGERIEDFIAAAADRDIVF